MIYSSLSYREKCFTGKYTSHKIHEKTTSGSRVRYLHLRLTCEDFNEVNSHFFSSYSLKTYNLTLFLPNQHCKHTYDGNKVV